jgi:hypothetical protein
LAFGEEKFGKSVGVHESDDRAGQTTPYSANTDGTKFVGVISILVEGEETTISQIFGEFRGGFIVKEQGKEFSQKAEAFGVVGLVGGGQAEGFNSIGEVAKGAIGGARLELHEGGFNDFRGDGDPRVLAVWFASAGVSTGMHAGRVKVLTE